METLIQERLPHAPQMGLFVAPNVPDDRLERALSGYAPDVNREEVVALYDATLSGTGGDGALFLHDRFVFQNSNFQAPQTVRYDDLVGVTVRSQWFGLGGRVVDLTVNRGRATFDLTLDFSGAPEAADYVADFLDAALLRDVSFDAAGPATTDVNAVERALKRLHRQGKLSEEDRDRLLEVLTQLEAE